MKLVEIHQMWSKDLKPGSYFLRMRIQSEFDVNLTSQPSFYSDIRKWVEQSWTAANYPLRIFDVNIRIRMKYDPDLTHEFDCFFCYVL